MTPDRSHSDTVGCVANKVAPFNPYFYVPKYRSSDALPAPEIFSISCSQVYGPSQKLEQLSRERSKQKNLIHEMVMSKLQSAGKAVQDRKAKRSSRSSSSPFNSSSQNSLLSQLSDESKTEMKLAESATSVENKENIRVFDANCPRTPCSSSSIVCDNNASASVWTTPSLPLTCDSKYAESFSLPDIRKALSDAGDSAITPVQPSATRLEILKSTESIRQQARTRARLMSDSELGLSPEEKLKLLKQKIAARKAVQSAYVDYPRSEEFLDEKMSFSNRVLSELQNAISEADSKTGPVSNF